MATKSSLLVRIFKWTGLVLLLLIVLLVAAPFIFKDKIVAVVKEETNAALNAKVDFGDFDLSLFSSFPDFRFKIQNVSVVGMGDFEGDTLMALGELSTDINLKSVLSGDKYQINAIVLDRARINAIVLKDGRANWDITQPSADTAAAATKDTSVTRFKLGLKEFRISNSTIVYDDRQSNLYSKLEGMNYTLKGDFTQDVFQMGNELEILKTTFKMDGIPYLSNAHAKASAQLDMDMTTSTYVFKENEFVLNDLTLGLDGKIMMPDTNIDMDLKFNTRKTEFKSVLSLIPAVYSKDFESVQTAGKFELNGFFKGRYNAVEMPAFGINLAVIDAMFKYPSLPKSVNNINVKVNVTSPTSNLNDMVVDVSKFHVEMAGNPVDMSARITTPMTDVGLAAAIKGDINLASIKDVVPLEKDDNLSGTIHSDITLSGHMSAIEKEEYDKFKAQGELVIDKMDYRTATLTYPVQINTMKMNFTTQYVELQAFDALLGKSDVNATGRIDNLIQYMFKDELIKGSFTVSSQLMDLNELMGPPTPTTAADTAAVASATTEGAAEVPANIDFVLDTHIDKLLYDTYTIEDMTGKVVVRDQKADMSNLRMKIIDGLLTMNGYYETTNPKKPTVALNFKLEGFDIQKTFKTFNSVQKLAPVGEYAKGTFTATLENFNTTLNAAMEPDLKTVNATGVFKTNDVNVGGFPPFVKLGEALKIEQLKSVSAKNINAKYAIRDGRIFLEPFDTKINGMNTTIAGSTGLDQTIDYKYKMEIPRSMFGGAANSALNGLVSKANSAAGTNVNLGDKINVNIGFGGTVTKPTVTTGLKEEGKSAVATATTQAYNAAVDKASEEAKKIIDEAEKQVAKIREETKLLAERTRTEGYAQADKAVEQATNPLAKMAAKKAADVAKKKVDEKVQKMVDESEVRCAKIIDDARAKADAKTAESKK